MKTRWRRTVKELISLKDDDVNGGGGRFVKTGVEMVGFGDGQMDKVLDARPLDMMHKYLVQEA